MPYVFFACIVLAYLNIRFARQLVRYKMGSRQSLTMVFIVLLVINLGGITSLVVVPILLYGLFLARKLNR